VQPPQYIWQRPGWPKLTFDTVRVAQEVALARRAQGVVEGKLAALGFKERQELAAEAWAQEAVATAAIEGERLDLLTVRSSVARRLGTADQKGPGAPRHVDGLLDIMDDAVTRAKEPLTHERLHAWQAALFPAGFSGMRPVKTAAYRIGAMQIVSGRAGNETVHYEAPAALEVPGHMQRLLEWFNAGDGLDSIVKAALSHVWFETIHPYEDGNGRVGRNMVDLCLARDAGDTSRLVRISQRLLEQRDAYYGELGQAQHGDGDTTAWVVWFVAQVRAAWENASEVVEASLEKARFWARHAALELTARRRKAVYALLDRGPGGFEGGMNTRKYVGLTGTSRPTASRELIELNALGVLKQVGGGRSTRYYINLPGWVPEAA
jgi:Fic family protein